MYETNPEFDPLNDVDLDDIDFDYVENEDGSVTYDAPTEEAEEADEEDYTGYGEQPTTIDAHELIAALGDNDELNLGDRKMTKGKLLELATKADEVEAEHTYVSSLASNLKHSEKHLEFIKKRSLSEVDKQIAAVEDILRDRGLSYEERGRRHDQREKLITRQNELNAEFTNGEQLILAQKNELLGVRLNQTNEAMLRKYGSEWNAQQKDVFDFAYSLGVSQEALREVINPAMADILVMARKYAVATQRKKEKATQEIKATIARSRTPRKTHTPVGTPTRKPARPSSNARDASANEFDMIDW